MPVDSQKVLWENRCDVIRQINQFNLHSEVYSWLITLWLTQLTQFNIQLVGNHGTGKSRSMRDLPQAYLDSVNVKDDNLIHYISGHRSPLQFYTEMWQHHSQLIAVEEADVLQSDKQISDMFRTGFYPPYLFEWQSTVPPKSAPPAFYFMGSVCMGTNSLGDLSNPHRAASYDRFYVANLEQSPKDIREKQRDMWEGEKDTSLFGFVLHRIYHLRNKGSTAGLDTDDYAMLNEILDEYYSGKSNPNMSVRDAERLQTLAFHLKSFFGKMDDDCVINLLTDIFLSLGVNPKRRVWHNRKLFDLR